MYNAYWQVRYFIEDYWKFILIGLVVVGIVGLIAMKILAPSVVEVTVDGQPYTFDGKTTKIEQNGKKIKIPVDGALFDKEGKLVYMGTFNEKGEITGTGEFYDEDGRAIYMGDVVNGKREGFGEELITVWVTKQKPKYVTIYSGEFKADKREGVGKEFTEGGALRYEGNFANGLYNGQGKFYNADGSLRYDGVFENGITNAINAEIADNIRYIDATTNFRFYVEYAYSDYKPFIQYFDGLYEAINREIDIKDLMPVSLVIVETKQYIKDEAAQLGLAAFENDKVLLNMTGKEIFITEDQKQKFGSYIVHMAMTKKGITGFPRAVLREYYDTILGYVTEEGVSVAEAQKETPTAPEPTAPENKTPVNPEDIEVATEKAIAPKPTIEIQAGFPNKRKLDKAYREVPSYKLTQMIEGDFTPELAHAFGQFLKEQGVWEDYVKLTMEGRDQTEILELILKRSIEDVDGLFVQWNQYKRSRFIPVVQAYVFENKDLYDKYLAELAKVEETEKIKRGQ